MAPQDWGVVGGLFTMLVAVAGYLGAKVIDHGEKIAGLLMHKDDIQGRLDKQDNALANIDRKLDALMIRWNVRTTPPGGTELR